MPKRSTSPDPQTACGRFIALVKEQMQAQGLSHKDLAARLGCTTVNVTQYFQPGKTLHFRTAEKLAAVLGMSLEVTLVQDFEIVRELQKS